MHAKTLTINARVVLSGGWHLNGSLIFETTHGQPFDRIGQGRQLSLAQLSIRYTLQLGLVTLPKTANPEHMRANADLDFEISADDMELLHDLDRIEHYGDAKVFPIYRGT